MIIVGLTGGVATGKSTVSAYMIEKGVTVIEADKIEAEVIKPGKPAYNKIKEAFGADIIKSDETINRELLTEIVSKNAEKRKILNSITYPYVRWEIYKRIIVAFFKLKRYVVLDVPLVIASKFGRDFYKIIVVKVVKDQQLIRLLIRDKLVKSQAEARIATQPPLDMKFPNSTFIINNNGPVKSTMKQVDSIVNRLNSSRAYLKTRIGFILSFINMLCLIYLFVYRFCLKPDPRNKS